MYVHICTLIILLPIFSSFERTRWIKAPQVVLTVILQVQKVYRVNHESANANAPNLNNDT